LRRGIIESTANALRRHSMRYTDERIKKVRAAMTY